ncbi:nitrate/nitrite two-component system sensor histidine kinase NarQ [Vibrio clamense]|uniref:nitrate/nitrite two-component system sensor histidine kinase NarQ n=1 Tax=Vibrio clamense TaxID=2910254 RepID=UPI003D25221F
MLNKPVQSVTNTIAKALVLILLLSVATTGFAIITLASSLNDAEAVNVAGSMRMQSYRLSHDIQTKSVDYGAHIAEFENSLYSPSMKALQGWTVPKDITMDYYRVIVRWHELKDVLRSKDKSQYLVLVANFVTEIDGFVFKLQQFSELKLIKLAWAGGFGLGGILIVSFFVVHFVRKEVVKPLNALVIASEQIKNRSFDVKLNVTSNNELGILTRTFNTMADDLGKMYLGLELAVNEKTHKLQHANQSLEVLYNSSQELTGARISQDNFHAILQHIVSLEGIRAAKLEITDVGGRALFIEEGVVSSSTGHKSELQVDGNHLGFLYCEYGLPCPDQTLIDNFVQILSRAVYYNQAQKQAEQLILMEERATIARELHDSLAQSLSYLKIQVTLLKRVIGKCPVHSNSERTALILEDLGEGLSGAYTQLRELLTTFRLTIKEGSFGEALVEMTRQLAEQTDAKITLANHLSSVELDAHEQVHLLQLIREATINGIKHAKAQNIEVLCELSSDEVMIKISDDGVGFDLQDPQLNHYGMSIMQERSSRLNGKLEVNSSKGNGCEIILKYRSTKEL